MQSVLRTNHVKTWLLWINELSPISPKISNVSLPEREMMATALAMASPGGPAGIRCVDECRCGEDIPAQAAKQIFDEVLDRGHRIPDPAHFLTLVREAIIVDLTAPHPRTVVPTRDLADFGFVISTRGASVAHARTLFPRAWTRIAEETVQR